MTGGKYFVGAYAVVTAVVGFHVLLVSINQWKDLRGLRLPAWEAIFT